MKIKLLFLSAAIVLILLAILSLKDKIFFRKQTHGLQGAVLILLDTVRADHLSCYGYSRDTSPNLSKLAQEGVLFEQAVSCSPWTLPSVANILSASLINERVFNKTLKYSVVESISNAGYASAAFTEGGYVSSRFGFDLGFMEYAEEEGAVQFLSLEKPRDPHFTGSIEKTFSKAKKWLSEHRDDKFFLFIHTYEPHVPYMRRTFTEGLEPGKVGTNFTTDTLLLLRNGKLSFNDQELEYLEALYDGGILESDRHVGAFLDFLKKVGLRDKTLIVVTSDHGEDLGDHYRSNCGDHGHSLHDNQLLVPLIIYNPCSSYLLKKVAHQIRLMDVMPTIAEILNVPIDFTTTGKSLLPLMHGEENTGRSAKGGDIRAGPQRVFLRYLGYKYIKVVGPPSGKFPPLNPLPPTRQLYDLKADPKEQINLAQTEPLLAQEIQDNLALFLGPEPDTFATPEVVNETLRKRLKSLGYLQ